MKLTNFIHYQQTMTTNSCWVACAAMILKYLFPKADYSYIEMRKIAMDNRMNPDARGNPLDLISIIDPNMPLSGDDCALPIYDEIEDTILMGRPLLCCISKKKTKVLRKTKDYVLYEPRWEVTDETSHWVVIFGFEASERKIWIADPAENTPECIDYSSQKYGIEYYWQNTTYIGLKAPDE